MSNRDLKSLRDDELIDLDQLRKLIGGDPLVSKATVRRWIAGAILPEPIVLGPATLRWRVSEVRAALKKLKHGKGTWKIRKIAPETRSVIDPAG
jgi:predicted DNA-binding transcriptional regulator AlpA